MAQHLNKDVPDKRREFCEWALTQVNKEANFLTNLLTDEIKFYVNEKVNFKNISY